MIFAFVTGKLPSFGQSSNQISLVVVQVNWCRVFSCVRAASVGKVGSLPNRRKKVTPGDLLLMQKAHGVGAHPSSVQSSPLSYIANMSESVRLKHATKRYLFGGD